LTEKVAVVAGKLLSEEEAMDAGMDFQVSGSSLIEEAYVQLAMTRRFESMNAGMPGVLPLRECHEPPRRGADVP
jgi:hypothetical protein